MGRKYNFDYIIIGSGPAGSTAALELAKAHKKVCLIENRFFGGSNLHTRDLPYLTALDFAHTYFKTIQFPELSHQDIPFNFPALPARIHQLTTAASTEHQATLQNAGVTCVKGFANLLDEHTVAVGDQRLTTDSFILATGSKLNTAGIGNVNLVKHLTPDTAIKATRLPQVIAVIGGGSTGAEIAEYYAELGVKVIIFEAGNYFLPREDREISDCLTDYFQTHLGITVLSSCRVVALEEDGFSKRVVFRYQNSEKMVRVDSIILATGSTPVLDYGLENAKVRYTSSGITVNKFFETSTKNIYAIGDCLGHESSTDRAVSEAMCLALNLINKTKNTLDYRGTVRTIKTSPEIATVGFTENDLLKLDRKYQKSLISLDTLPVSQFCGFTHGLIKLLADRTGHIIGATIIADHAETLISELALALRHHLTVLELASTPHVNNSPNYLIKLAAREIYNSQKKKPDTKIIKLTHNPKLNTKKLQLHAKSQTKPQIKTKSKSKSKTK